MNKRQQTNAILAGLRLLQAEIDNYDGPESTRSKLGSVGDILTNMGRDSEPGSDEIDGLCETINLNHLEILTQEEFDMLTTATEIAFDDDQAVPPDLRAAASAVYDRFHPNQPTVNPLLGYKRITTEYFHGAPLDVMKADPERFMEGHRDEDWLPIQEGE